MNDITRYHTGEKLSRVVVHNGIAYLCGQVDPNYMEHPEDIEAQTRGVLTRIDGHLSEAGTDKSRMLFCGVHIRDITLAPKMNAFWNDWLKDCAPPARCCVQAEMAKPQILVEITVQAALP